MPIVGVGHPGPDIQRFHTGHCNVGGAVVSGDNALSQQHVVSQLSLVPGKARGQTISCTSPVSSSMVTNTVPFIPRGCCRATGQPATKTCSPSGRLSMADADRTSEGRVGLANSIICPLAHPTRTYSYRVNNKNFFARRSFQPSVSRDCGQLAQLSNVSKWVLIFDIFDLRGKSMG